MPGTKLSCPECSAVLNPKKPPTPGKKVRCPRCQAIFAVPKEQEAEAIRQPAKKKPKPAPAKPAAKPVSKKKPVPDDDEEGGVYGFSDHVEEGAPEIEYVPDLEVKNPRGPATAKVIGPTNMMLLLSALLALLSAGGVCFWVWPFLFTRYGTTYDPAEFKGGFKKAGEGDKKEGEGGGGGKPKEVKLEELTKTERAEWDEKVSDERLERSLWAGACFLAMIYTAIVAMAVVKFQNLESYRWSMAASVMGMLYCPPFGIWGVNILKQEKIQEAFVYKQD